MPKENYKAWEVRINSFDSTIPIEKQLEFLLSFAILSPSGHNSQPWKCKINANTLSIFINKEHSLSQSDPKQRQLFISFGCFLENLLIAADYYGFSTKIEESFLDEKQARKVISVTFDRTGGVKKDDSHLIFQTPNRHSNRYKYINQAVPEVELEKLANLGTNNVKIIYIQEQKLKSEIAEILGNAQVESMENSNFRDELSHYIKSNFTKEKFGMPGFALAIPSLVSIFASKLIKKINLSKLSAKQDLQLLQKFTPVIGILCSKEDNKSAWLESGKIFEKLWLLATSDKLVLSVWAAATQDEHFRSQLQNKIPTELTPVVIFRLGYPKVNVKPSPRFLLADILQ